MLDRRRLLTTLALPLASCATRRFAIQPPVSGLRLPRVNVSQDRIIRTVVGLRPYRPSGFVVRAESIDGKTIVHNYGHGGGGITLSWGTAHLATELALPTGAPRMAVLGAGAVGLATARLLQERGVAVTIYTKALPPETTSNIAGGQWFPVTVFERDKATPAFLSQYVEAARFAYRRYQLMLGDYYGIRWFPNYYMSNEPFSNTGLMSKQSIIADLLPRLTDLTPGEHPFSFPYVRRMDSMFIQPSIYLEAMLREFRIAGGVMQVKELHDVREILGLPEQVAINCTGLGAKALFNDDELTPIKGQLTVLEPQPEIEYATLPPDLYMFPRKDGIVLGGTHQRGVWDLAPDREAEARIVEGHAKVFREMRG